MPVPAFFDSPDPRIHMDNSNLFMDIGLMEDTPMSMQLVLDLNHLDEPGFIAKGTTIGNRMADAANAALVTGAPFTGTQILGFITAFSGKRQAGIDLVSAKKTITTQKNSAHKTAEDALTQTKKHFESKSGFTTADAQT